MSTYPRLGISRLQFKLRVMHQRRGIHSPRKTSQSLVANRPGSLPHFAGKSLSPVDQREMSTVSTLVKVNGFSDRQNTLMLSSDENVRSVVQNVIFFPGDIQNYQSKMSENSQSRQWKDWSYESTMDILRKRFPSSMVWLVQPSKLHDDVFSCFANFLHCDMMGSPENVKYFDAIVHLEMLLQQGSQQFMSMQAANRTTDKTCQDGYEEERVALSNLPVTLVGFSKGCVVLNQIIYELGNSSPEEAPSKHYTNFLKRLRSIVWLDGGHASPDVDVWITDKKVLSKLVTLDCELHVHVTSWQIHDFARPHIGEQERLFVDTLKSLGVRITEKLHFPGERKFHNHFNIFHEF